MLQSLTARIRPSWRWPGSAFRVTSASLRTGLILYGSAMTLLGASLAALTLSVLKGLT